MKRFLFPVEYYRSTYNIDFKHYYDLGYRGIIFDIDNTLVPHDAMSDERSRKLLKDLREIGFKIIFLSNNDEPRVKNFAKEINADGLSTINYIYKAKKPLKDSYIKAAALLKIETKNMLFIGDQIFTDILGANNASIHSILVDKVNKKEDAHIYLKRILEYPVKGLYLMKHRKK